MTFSMWSIGHYFFLLSPFILIILLTVYTKKNSHELNRKIGISLSFITILILILRNLEIWIVSNFLFNVELIPFQVCHFANFVILTAFITKKQIWFNFALTLNAPAAFVSILFANSLTNYETIISFRGFAYIAGHVLLVFIPIWAYNVGFIKLRLKGIFQTFKLVALLYVLSIFVNNFMYALFDQYANYFYSLKPESGTPLESLYELGQEFIWFDFFKINPLYLILTGLLGIVVMLIFYFGFYTHQQKIHAISTKKRLSYRDVF